MSRTKTIGKPRIAWRDDGFLISVRLEAENKNYHAQAQWRIDMHCHGSCRSTKFGQPFIPRLEIKACANTLISSIIYRPALSRVLCRANRGKVGVWSDNCCRFCHLAYRCLSADTDRNSFRSMLCKQGSSILSLLHQHKSFSFAQSRELTSPITTSLDCNDRVAL